MIDLQTALATLNKTMAPAVNAAGFSSVRSNVEGASVFSAEAGTLSLTLEEGRAELRFSPKPFDGEEEITEADFKRVALSLLDLDTADDKDLQYIGNDFSDEILKRFGPGGKAGNLAAVAKKLPKSVSKTAIKNGDAYYDPVSFGNSFTGIYPELRQAYKDNYETHGEFLAEDFFLRFGNAAVLNTIRRYDGQQMKRLFNLFNAVYENGTNDTQGLVVVTILGSLNNDQELIGKCIDFMSKDLAPVVLRTNKFLASPAGAKSKHKLENPPRYKPKKEKKPGLLSQMMGGGGQSGFPGM